MSIYFLKIQKMRCLPLISILLVVFSIMLVNQVFAQQKAEEEHQALLLENRFPSATTCRTCHPDHYREW